MKPHLLQELHFPLMEADLRFRLWILFWWEADKWKNGLGQPLPRPRKNLAAYKVPRHVEFLTNYQKRVLEKSFAVLYVMMCLKMNRQLNKWQKDYWNVHKGERESMV